MKKWPYGWFILLAFLVSCTFPLPEYDYTVDSEAVASCQKQGGKYGLTKISPMIVGCALPTNDAGKECRGSSECESYCVSNYTGPFNITEPLQGTCWGWQGFPECIPTVEQGKPLAALCIDYPYH